MKKIKFDPCYIITKFSWFKFFRNPPLSSPLKFPIIILHERYSIRTHVWKIWEGSQIERENGGVSFSSCIRGPWWAMIIFFLNSRSMISHYVKILTLNLHSFTCILRMVLYFKSLSDGKAFLLTRDRTLP